MKTRYTVLALLATLSVITYLDRVCISIAGPRIQQDLGISTQQWGWVLGAFILSYGLFEIPSGALGDRMGHRITLSRIVVWWSLFTMLTGSCRTFMTLVVCRFLFGMGEAGAFPNAAGSIGRWFPHSETGRAQGVIWGASRLGGMLSPLLVIPLMSYLGWRPVFYIFGLVGVVWAGVWFWWYRDWPERQPSVSPEELAEISLRRSAGAELSHDGIPWRELLVNRQLWIIMAMYSCYVWGSMFYLTWFPEYLQKGRHLSNAELSIFTALPFLLGAAGNLVGGALTDALSQRYGLIVGRRWMGASCLFISGLLLFATSLTSGKMAAVVMLALGFAVLDCMLPTAWALCLDVGGRYAGAVSGAMNSAGQAGGLICTVLYGYIVGSGGHYDLGLSVIATMVILSSLLFLLIDPNRPLIAQPVGQMDKS